MAQIDTILINFRGCEFPRLQKYDGASVLMLANYLIVSLEKLDFIALDSRPLVLYMC